jgi:hypothetical protein
MREIRTSNEFVYDILKNLTYHNEVVVNKPDVNLSLQSILGRLDGKIIVQDKGNTISITKATETSYKPVFERKQR